MHRVPAPAALTAVTWSRSTLIVTMHGWSVQIPAKRRADLPRAIREALSAPEGQQLPFSILLVLAWIEHTGRLPDDAGLTAARMVATAWIPLPPPIEERSVDDVLQVGHAFVHYVPTEPWPRARWLIRLAAAVWTCRGDEARPWGRIPLEAWDTIISTPATMTFSLLAGWCRPPTLPIPYADTMELAADAYIEWMSLAVGPTPPPRILRPDGLGAPTESPLAMSADDTHALSHDRGTLFIDTARSLLTTPQRPGPRYVQRALLLDVPLDLLPELRPWGLARVLVIPEHQGLWCSLLDAHDVSVGAIWWDATPDTASAVPLAVPPSFWVCLHLLLAALWFDLCQERLVLSGDSRQGTDVQTPASHPSSQRPQKRRLPPPRSKPHQRHAPQHVTWIAEANRAQLQRTVLLGNAYRRLPAGWEDRIALPDFHRRRAAAEQRARDHGAAPPPPGWTFVQPFLKGAALPPAADVSDSDPLPILSRGLVALVLAFRGDQTIDDDA